MVRMYLRHEVTTLVQQSQADGWVGQWDRAPLALNPGRLPVHVEATTSHVCTSVHVDDTAQMATGQFSDVVQPFPDC